jgi:hypothetical protein
VAFLRHRSAAWEAIGAKESDPLASPKKHLHPVSEYAYPSSQHNYASTQKTDSYNDCGHLAYDPELVVALEEPYESQGNEINRRA